jgi:hypothetical protein
MYNGVLAPNADISLVLPDAIAALVGFPAMEPGNAGVMQHCGIAVRCAIRSPSLSPCAGLIRECDAQRIARIGRMLSPPALAEPGCD